MAHDYDRNTPSPRNKLWCPSAIRVDPTVPSDVQSAPPVVSTIDGALQLISHSYGRQCPGIRLCNKDERATMLTLPCGDPNCRQCLVANQKRRCATCACLLHAAQLTCPCGALRPPRRAGHHGAAAAAGGGSAGSMGSGAHSASASGAVLGAREGRLSPTGAGLSSDGLRRESGRRRQPERLLAQAVALLEEAISASQPRRHPSNGTQRTPPGFFLFFHAPGGRSNHTDLTAVKHRGLAPGFDAFDHNLHAEIFLPSAPSTAVAAYAAASAAEGSDGSGGSGVATEDEAVCWRALASAGSTFVAACNGHRAGIRRLANRKTRSKREHQAQDAAAHDVLADMPPPVVTSATSVFHRDAAYTHTGHSLAAGHGLPALSNAAAFGGVSYAAALEPLPLPITGSGYDGVTLDAPFHSADLHGSDLVPPPPKRGK